MTRLPAAGAALTLLLAPGAALAQAPPGDIMLDIRLRYETVDQDRFAEDAQAITLRTRFGYQTPAWRGFKALVEGENVTALVEDYNSSTNGKTRYPLVTDPEDTELNRAQISWSGQPGELVVGRQRVILGSARYVGNVGFRQNEQTFDAVKAALRPNKDLTLTYAYVDRVHRIFGDDHPQGEWDADGHLIEVAQKTPAGLLTGYGFLLDIETAPAQSSATWGARFAGAHKLSVGLSATYELEYARQNDYGNSPTDFELEYVALGAGLKGPTRWASVGLERLGGDGRRGFSTPFATLHAFQGWADVFLATPADGVRDLNLKAGTTLKLGPRETPVKFSAAAHHFTDEDGSRRYGRELDLLVAAPLTKQLTAEVKAAFFNGARPAYADRSKLWITLEYRY